jgi:chemotaxis signal transduction protein
MQGGAIVVFKVSKSRFAAPHHAVKRLAPAPRLSAPPNAVPALAGFFQYGPELISVLNFYILFDLPGQREPRLYDHLILLRRPSPRIALLVDRVSAVIKPKADELKFVTPGHSRRDCIIAEVRGYGDPILLIDIQRVIAGYERERTLHFEDQERRLRNAFGEPDQ